MFRGYTINAIDGGVFSLMKKLMNIHTGFTKSLKLYPKGRPKIVDFYLVYYHLLSDLPILHTHQTNKMR